MTRAALSLRWAILPDRDGWVCELWSGDDQFAEVNAENEQLAVEFYPRRDQKPWVLPFEDVAATLARAKTEFGNRAANGRVQSPSRIQPTPDALRLAKLLSFHVLHGAWARDDVALLALAEKEAPALDIGSWQSAGTADQAALVERLLRKAADSDWSWEVHSLTGHDPSEFRAALAGSRVQDIDA